LVKRARNEVAFSRNILTYAVVFPQRTAPAMPGHKLDPIDRHILAELQADGRMTNVELASRVGISAPPCLRRVRALEEAGYIRGYHADVDPRELGFEVAVFAMVRLRSQAEADLSAFENLCCAWPLVRECHMLNGEIDFILKCVAPDLSSFQAFLTGQLLTADNVASVKTSLVIRCAKDEPGLSFEVLEARLAKSA
jgi:DNA-binding Lrp family transcriptional regulator